MPRRAADLTRPIRIGGRIPERRPGQVTGPREQDRGACRAESDYHLSGAVAGDCAGMRHGADLENRPSEDGEEARQRVVRDGIVDLVAGIGEDVTRKRLEVRRRWHGAVHAERGNPSPADGADLLEGVGLGRLYRGEEVVRLVTTGREVVLDGDEVLAGGQALDRESKRDRPPLGVRRVVAVQIAVLPALSRGWSLAVGPLVKVRPGVAAWGKRWPSQPWRRRLVPRRVGTRKESERGERGRKNYGSKPHGRSHAGGSP